MSNPLSQLFNVEERDDGVYISVTPEEKVKTNINTIERALDNALVLNYDLDMIAGVIDRASGEPELIGPPFEFYDPSFDKYVDVNITTQSATMRINSMCLADSIKPTPESVIFCLKRKGVRFGINQKKVSEAVLAAKHDIDVPIAFAKDPVKGKDARIELEMDLNPDLKPQRREDGSVDYRNVKAFVQVGKDQVIARKTPPTEGEPGIAVSGEKLAAEPGRDIPFPNGSNTYISEDGVYLMASRSGVIKREGTLISVTEQLAIGKNVDFSVGNVKHAGDVVIGGDVKPGFVVEAEGNITIRGQMEAARIISRNGTVTIQQGVLGKGEGYVYGKVGINTAFAQEATLETDGELTIERNCLHCTCTCQICRAVERHSTIVGGVLKAGKFIEARQTGNEKLVETRIALYDKKRVEAQEKLKEINDLKKSLLEKLEPVKKQVKTKAALLKKAGSATTERQRLEIKKWVDTFNALNMKLKYVDKRIEELKKKTQVQAQYDGYIKITGDIYQGTLLDLYGMTKKIDTRMTNKTFKVSESQIQY